MRKMLIAEDESVTRRGIRELVQWEHYGIAICAETEHGLAALQATRELVPDVALVDIRMPLMDGLEYCRRVTEEGIAPAIVIISAYDQFRYVQRALRYGVKDYVLKPFDEAELVEAVQRALERGRADGALVGFFERFDVEAKDRTFRRAVVRHIQQHFTEPIQLGGLARRVAVTTGHLAHRVKREFGVTLTELTLAYRCEVAKGLLRDPRQRVREVAEQVGYRDAQAFSEVFKRNVGSTPREYRRTH